MILVDDRLRCGAFYGAPRASRTSGQGRCKDVLPIVDTYFRVSQWRRWQ